MQNNQALHTQDISHDFVDFVYVKIDPKLRTRTISKYKISQNIIRSTTRNEVISLFFHRISRFLRNL